MPDQKPMEKPITAASSTLIERNDNGHNTALQAFQVTSWRTQTRLPQEHDRNDRSCNPSAHIPGMLHSF